jgi:hypothetical protein
MLATVAAGYMLASFTLAAQPEAAPSGSMKVARNTLLQCSLLQPLDPATAKPGDDAPLRLTRPLAVGGVVVLPEGSLIHGQVTKVTPAGRRCAKGQVKWKLEEIPLPDGGQLKIQVWAAFRDANARVPADSVQRHTSGEIVGYVIRDAVLLPLMPAGLVIGAGEAVVTKPFRRGACRPSENPPLPADATIAVRVRASQKFHY